MTLSKTFWRWLAYALALSLIITGWNLYMRTGYPKEWDRVRYGMHGAEVWFICGQPTISSGGMKADFWAKPFLFGQWELWVYCGDILGHKPSIVTDIRLYYESLLTGKVWIKSYSPHVHIVDRDAFERAFGFHPEPEGAPPQQSAAK